MVAAVMGLAQGSLWLPEARDRVPVCGARGAVMKLSAPTMVTTMWAVLAMAAAVMGNNQGHEEASVTQVRETLQNLLRSVEDEGRDSEAIFKKRGSWCAAVTQARQSAAALDDTDLMQLKADLQEQEAAVEEAAGTVRQIQADITLVQQTLNRTTEMLGARRREETQAFNEVQAAQQELQSQGLPGATVFLEADTSKLNASLATREATLREQYKVDIQLLEDLVANKKQMLASMQDELEAVLPMLAQLQETAG